MFACCNLTYLQYLNRDESINKKKYWKMIHNLRTEDPEFFQKLYERDLLKIEKLCKCPCHVVGANVMH